MKSKGFLSALIIIALVLLSRVSSCRSESELMTPYGEIEDGEYCDTGNPYSPSQEGHYAGYEWAEENDPSSCGGNSESFIEGCEEFLRQQECSVDSEERDPSDSYY